MRRGGSRSGLRPKCFYPLTFQPAVGCVRHRTKAAEPKCFCPLILASVTSVYHRTLAAHQNPFAHVLALETMWSSYDPPDRYEPRRWQ